MEVDISMEINLVHHTVCNNSTSNLLSSSMGNTIRWMRDGGGSMTVHVVVYITDSSSCYAHDLTIRCFVHAVGSNLRHHGSAPDRSYTGGMGGNKRTNLSRSIYVPRLLAWGNLLTLTLASILSFKQVQHEQCQHRNQQ